MEHLFIADSRVRTVLIIDWYASVFQLLLVDTQEMMTLFQSLFSFYCAIPSFTNAHKSLIACIAQVFSLNSPLFCFGLQYKTWLLYLPALFCSAQCLCPTAADFQERSLVASAKDNVAGFFL